MSKLFCVGDFLNTGNSWHILTPLVMSKKESLQFELGHHRDKSERWVKDISLFYTSSLLIIDKDLGNKWITTTVMQLSKQKHLDTLQESLESICVHLFVQLVILLSHHSAILRVEAAKLIYKLACIFKDESSADIIFSKAVSRLKAAENGSSI
jgi:hypothetical protein